MFNVESYREPFWAKSGDFVRGRDPLGIQNSSISTYSKLLPGMTNLTLRLRYYGFYLWILEEYDKLPANHYFKESPKMQYTFVRRGELIIAFLMGINHPKQLSIIGSNFVSNHESEFLKFGYLDVSKGADKDKNTAENKVYWDYESGALGQYYAGSLISLDLIEVRSYYFTPKKRGKALAAVYGSNVSEEAKSLLLSIINTGNLRKEDLKFLEEFSISRNVSNSPEGKFYINMLLEDDGENFKNLKGEILAQRKETLSMMLSFLKEEDGEIKWFRLPEINYYDVNKGKIITNEAGLGWFYYYLNELCHYSLETIFWGLLIEMDGNIYSVNELTEKLAAEVLDNIIIDINIPNNTLLSSVIENFKDYNFQIFELIEEIENCIPINDNINGISAAILAIITCYSDNQSRLLLLEEYAIKNGLSSKNGNALQLFDKYIVAHMDVPFEEFIKKTISILLNDHITIAYDKMGNGTKNLLKFIVEDNVLVHIETMTPNFTNPRLRTLHNFLQDLSLIDEKDKLTELGESILYKINAK